jgi:hypothetical protein
VTFAVISRVSSFNTQIERLVTKVGVTSLALIGHLRFGSLMETLSKLMATLTFQDLTLLAMFAEARKTAVVASSVITRAAPWASMCDVLSRKA